MKFLLNFQMILINFFLYSFLSCVINSKLREMRLFVVSLVVRSSDTPSLWHSNLHYYCYYRHYYFSIYRTDTLHCYTICIANIAVLVQ